MENGKEQQHWHVRGMQCARVNAYATNQLVCAVALAAHLKSNTESGRALIIDHPLVACSWCCVVGNMFVRALQIALNVYLPQLVVASAL